MRKILTGLLICLMICYATCAFSACATAAIWGTQKTDSRETSANIAERNPSAPYIVYAALDANGDFIERGDNSSEADAYAVIGYTGTVKELVIPDEYAGKRITKVLVDPDYASHRCFCNGSEYTADDPRLANNPYVESIVFGLHVTFVGGGVCVGMTDIKTLSFLSATSMTIGTAAFAACPNLESVSFACTSGSVTLNGNFADLPVEAVTYAS